MSSAKPTPKPKPPDPQPVESAEDRLDEALDETFPASDPIAVDPAEPPEDKHKRR
jgi:hypothetical protein